MHILVQRYIDTSSFAKKYNNDATGCPAYDPKVLMKIVLFAYFRGIISSRKIEQACRENVIFMALACGMVPDHSTIAAFVSSMKEELVALFRAMLLVCEAQGLLGGTHCAFDGLKLPSHAAKAWRGTFADVRQQQEKLQEQVRKILEEHQRTDHEGEGSRAGAHHSEQAQVQEQIER
jgi:transposase